MSAIKDCEDLIIRTSDAIEILGQALQRAIINQQIMNEQIRVQQKNRNIDVIAETFWLEHQRRIAEQVIKEQE